MTEENPNTPQSHPDCPFSVGDLVQHRASGERGIVTMVNHSCKNPRHVFHPVWASLKAQQEFIDQNGKCEYAFDGTVDISLGMERDDIEIDASLLESVEN